jgi:Zn-dependent membrane protease YugP
MKIFQLNLLAWIMFLVGIILLGEYAVISLILILLSFLCFFYIISRPVEYFNERND